MFFIRPCPWVRIQVGRIAHKPSNIYLTRGQSFEITIKQAILKERTKLTKSDLVWQDET